MVQVVFAIHLLTALAIIVLVLLQQGKGAEAGASFGAGASQTLFGSTGSWNFFSKATALLAAVFFVTSISLAVIAKNSAGVGGNIIPELEQVDMPDIPVGDLPSADNQPETDIPVAPGG